MHKLARWNVIMLVAVLGVAWAAPAAAADPQPLAASLQTGGGPDVTDVRAGSPVISETFRRDSGNWLVGPTESGDRAIEDGMLVVDVTDKNVFVWAPYDGSPDEFDDFYLEVDTTHLAGPLDANYGMTFRNEDGSNFYFFEIDSQGSYALSKQVDEAWETIVEWTESADLDQGKGCENRLGVLAVGDWIVLYANDEELTRFQDDSFSGGWFTLAAGAYETAGTEIGFDNVRLWEAKPAQASSGISSGTTSRSAANATVTSDTLNVRSGPSTAYPIVSTLRRGDRVQMTGRTSDSKWVKINLSGKPQAWIAAQYLNPDVRVASLAVAQAPAPPPTPTPKRCTNEAYLILENHIGRYITVQVSDNNFRVEGKVGNVPGRYYVTLNGTGRYTVAAQLPNGGSTNFDLFVEPTADRCANRTGCLALCQTLTIPFWLE